jgi:hypothetical protein
LHAGAASTFIAEKISGSAVAPSVACIAFANSSSRTLNTAKELLQGVTHFPTATSYFF